MLYNLISSNHIMTHLPQSRVCTSLESLEELIMDITSHDLNRQIQKLVSNYKKTGREEFKLDAEYLRSEFDTWWNDETSSFCSPH